MTIKQTAAMYSSVLQLALFLASICASGGFLINTSQKGVSNYQRILVLQSTTVVHSSGEDPKSPQQLVASHPVLSRVYPALIDHKERYGHPNIPLGSKEGKQCETLRRLHIQGKLSAEVVNFLTELGFRWHSLEDVYETCAFDDLFSRLLNYEKTEGNVSPPKKYPADPELGAWVTGIRRTGQEKVLPEHAERLNAIGFEWTSPRKCGSAFMEQYRAIEARIANGEDDIWDKDVKVQGWIKAQQEACAKGALSETRKHYMETLLGNGWLDWTLQ